MNISTILDMAAEAFGERTGVVHAGTRMDYASLRVRAHAAAAAIKASGARYVVMLDVSSPAAPVAIFGAAYAGVPYVPLNYRLTKPEINELLARVTPGYVIVGDAYRALYGRLLDDLDIEILAWRVSLSTSPDAAVPAGRHSETGAPEPVRSVRQVNPDGAEADVPVYDWTELVPGASLEGPAVIAAEDTSVSVPAGGRLTVDSARNLVIEMAGETEA